MFNFKAYDTSLPNIKLEQFRITVLKQSYGLSKSAIF